MITVLVSHKGGQEWPAEASERTIIADLVQHAIEHFIQRGSLKPSDHEYTFQYTDADGNQALADDHQMLGDLPYEGQESTRIVRVKLVRIPT